MEQPARFHAREVARRFGVSRPASAAELTHVARESGAAVEYLPTLAAPGIYIADGRIAGILLRPLMPPRILAHELLHHLLRESLGPTCAAYTLTPRSWEERQAHLFERLLCGAPSRDERRVIKQALRECSAGQRRFIF